MSVTQSLAFKIENQDKQDIISPIQLIRFMLGDNIKKCTVIWVTHPFLIADPIGENLLLDFLKHFTKVIIKWNNIKYFKTLMTV